MSFVDNAWDNIQFIAEIGKNFIDREKELNISENLKKAISLVKAAKHSGASAVKFQTHVVEDELLNVDFTSPHFQSSDRYSWVDRNQRATPVDQFWVPLKKFCDSEKIEFFSTPMSRAAAEILEKIGVSTWKVGSGDVTDFPLLKYLCETKKPIIISTGMVGFAELQNVHKFLNSGGSEPVILYCVSEYPCSPSNFNLSSLLRLRELFPRAIVGFSDHSVDSDLPVQLACGLGARIIEKHFTFDRNAWGSDHKASLLPDEFKRMVDQCSSLPPNDLKISKKYLGDKLKELDGSNNQFRKYFRKGLIYSRDLEPGEMLSEKDIKSIRPLMLLETDSMEYDRVVGKTLLRKVFKTEKVRFTDYA